MSRVCGVGIRFVLGLHDISRDEVVARIHCLCNNLDERVDERCWNCNKSVVTCLIDEDIHFNFNRMSFCNFQLFNDNSYGWVIEYQVDCGGLYFNAVQVEDVYIDISDVIRLAKKVSNLLGYIDYLLLPYVYVESWDDKR